MDQIKVARGEQDVPIEDVQLAGLTCLPSIMFSLQIEPQDHADGSIVKIFAMDKINDNKVLAILECDDCLSVDILEEEDDKVLIDMAFCVAIGANAAYGVALGRFFNPHSTLKIERDRGKGKVIFELQIKVPGRLNFRTLTACSNSVAKTFLKLEE